MTIPYATSHLLPVPHGFFGRRGGVSKGEVEGLNCGFGSRDDPAAIRRNRYLAGSAVMPGAPVVTVRQVHGRDVLHATQPLAEDARPEADAIVTDRPGLLIGILAADCAPVLFADAEAGIVGAAHAGWRGAVGRVVASTVAAMEHLGARRARIAAAVGPAIARANYEVDDDFFRRFVGDDPENERFFGPGRAGHHQFDLESYVGARLADAGIARAELLGHDTYSREKEYYSFRRATHEGASDYGRQISLIGLPK